MTFRLPLLSEGEPNGYRPDTWRLNIKLAQDIKFFFSLQEHSCGVYGFIRD